MKIERYLTFLDTFTILICISTCSVEDGMKLEVGPTPHKKVPRSIRVFSRGPDPDDLIYKGPMVSKHLHNVVQGGTVGVEFNVKKGMGKFGPLWDKIRRFLPKFGAKKHPNFLPDDDPSKDDDVLAKDDPGSDIVLLDPVGKGLINPRIQPSANEELEWERV